MKKNFANVALALLAASAISIGCGDDDDSSNNNGGAGGSAGTSSAGKGGTTGTSGNGTGGSNKAGTSNGGTSNGGTSNGGKAGSESGGKGGSSSLAGAAGGDVGGAPMGGVESGGAAGDAGAGGAGGAGGAESIYTAEMIARGTLIVRNMALCGGCHTATAGQELGGNPQFKNGALPAPNLTPDPTGIGNWSDAQIITAFRDGVDDEGRHLDPAMPYWLFHNMSDDDALDVVAFLRSLPPKSGAVGDANPEAGTHPTPLSPSSFPDSSLQAADAGYAEAQMGKYLVSGVAQCVKCHSPSTAGLPSGSFLSGATPLNNTTIFASNLTPDATGLSGWTAADVATALKAGTNKAGATLCGAMPAAAKGYGGMTDADAHAIGVYLTTIPAVANAASDPTLEPACP